VVGIMTIDAPQIGDPRVLVVGGVGDREGWREGVEQAGEGEAYWRRSMGPAWGLAGGGWQGLAAPGGCWVCAQGAAPRPTPPLPTPPPAPCGNPPAGQLTLGSDPPDRSQHARLAVAVRGAGRRRRRRRLALPRSHGVVRDGCARPRDGLERAGEQRPVGRLQEPLTPAAGVRGRRRLREVLEGGGGGASGRARRHA